MGGSSKDGAPNTAVTPVAPPWLAGTSVGSMPQAMPGQLEAMASQLAQGGFGKPATNMAYLDNLYAPVKTIQWPAPPAPRKPGTPPTPPVTPRVPTPPTPPVTRKPPTGPTGRNSR